MSTRLKKRDMTVTSTKTAAQVVMVSLRVGQTTFLISTLDSSKKSFNWSNFDITELGFSV